jgi:nucleotide-binding universal stress UspA family protein
MVLLPRRRSNESGHRAKFLVIADETPEFDRALYFAARRAMRTGAALVVLCIVAPPEQQEWLGVGDLIQAEAEQKARAILDLASARARALVGIEAETVLRTGAKSDAILELITSDQDIAFLTLAAGTGTDGPGPLVQSLASKGVANFPVPVVIVPGSMSDADIDALA